MAKMQVCARDYFGSTGMITCVKASSSPSTLITQGLVGLLTDKITCGASKILSMSIRKRASKRISMLAPSTLALSVVEPWLDSVEATDTVICSGPIARRTLCIKSVQIAAARLHARSNSPRLITTLNWKKKLKKKNSQKMKKRVNG